MNIADFTNHSGGADGADMTWDEMGKKHGFMNHVHWRPEHLNNLTPEGHKTMLRDYMSAARALGRPEIFKYMELAQRNWFQVHHSEAIYAISYILQPGDKDTLGRENKSGKEVVAGGTGWAVEMAIQAGKPVYVFDMNFNIWHKWDDDSKTFGAYIGTPILTETYAGIGSRKLTKLGILAIESVYKKTKEECLMNTSISG